MKYIIQPALRDPLSGKGPLSRYLRGSRHPTHECRANVVRPRGTLHSQHHQKFEIPDRVYSEERYQRDNLNKFSPHAPYRFQDFWPFSWRLNLIKRNTL